MKRILLEKLFNNFQYNNIDYVVLRKHELIPDQATCENDIDLLCRREQRRDIFKFFRNNNYRFYQDSEIKNIYLYGAKPHDHFIDEKNGLHIDIVYNLSYRSPNEGEWVAVDKEIQEDIWKQIVVSDKFWKYEPAPIDKLIHIVCHCLLDKRRVDNYYELKIQELFQQVDKRILEKKLSLIFFKFSFKLMEYISFKEY
jgi:hypothetical protein